MNRIPTYAQQDGLATINGADGLPTTPEPGPASLPPGAQLRAAGESPIQPSAGRLPPTAIKGKGAGKGAGKGVSWLDDWRDSRRKPPMAGRRRSSGRPAGEAAHRAVAPDRREEPEFRLNRTQLEALVEQRTAELEQALRRVNELAMHDDLTGVGNRRDLNNQLQIERQLFARIGLPASIAILDLDGLKSVNDAFGHSAGDEAIKTFADILRREMRITDYLARFGGDEFVILLRGTAADSALSSLQRIREAVETNDWSAIAPGVALTASIGVASFAMSESVDETFNRADKALYRAKVGGRNRIVAADELV